MNLLIILILILATKSNAHQIVPQEIKQVALDDRNRIDPSSYNTTYYLYLPTTNLKQTNTNFNATLNFVIASSSSNQILEYCLPHRLTPKLPLWRINLNDLKWSPQSFKQVLSHYPYSPDQHNPLFIRADWLLSQLTDTSTSKSEAYYLLLYNKTSKTLTRNDVLSFWNVQKSTNLSFGLVENDSGVAISKTRIIENRPIARGYVWGTRDASSSDPFQDIVPPFIGFKHEAEEWIIGAPKFSLKSDPSIIGTLQYYFLALANGKIQTKADPALVEDRSRFRDSSQIRTPGSCIQCHIQGINYPKQNALRQLITNGADIYADKKAQERLELFHLLPITGEIKENNAKFQTIQKYITGMEHEEFLTAFRTVMKDYDKLLTLDRAGREVNFEELQLAFGAASNSAPTIQLNPRLVGLAHNIPISRQNWENLFQQAVISVKIFKKEL